MKKFNVIPAKAGIQLTKFAKIATPRSLPSTPIGGGLAMTSINSESGFSAILIVGLLAAGIIAGTYLVQNGGQFLPKAAEQEPLNPSAGKTKKCAEETNKEKCQKDNDETCAADKVTYCDNRQGSPRAIRKSGGYYDPSHGNADPDSGCVFDYREVSGKKSECGKTESKSGDVVYTTTDEAKILNDERKNSLSAREAQSRSGQVDNSAACTKLAEGQIDSTLKVFQDEKVAGNLARFYAILDGVPDLCVPSDLGVESGETAKTKDGVIGRQMLCSGSNGELTWRVISGDDLLLADKTPPDLEQTKKFYNCSERLKDARKKAGLPEDKPCQQ